MANPDYLALYDQIALETDPIQKQLLIDQLFQFEAFLTEEEKGIFGYYLPGYVEDDPGYRDNIFSSYLGIYYSDTGEISQ